MTVATVIEAPTIFERRVIANATAVPIGTIMKLEDDNTVVVSAASADPFGGIAWVEHTASEGVTEMTVAMNGIFSGIFPIAIMALLLAFTEASPPTPAE